MSANQRVRGWVVALSIALTSTFLVSAPSSAQAPAYPRPELLLSEARAIIEGAIAYAREQKFDIAVTVVDAWGNVVSGDRMDGASLRHIIQAQGKAYAAALYRQPTERIAHLAKTQPERYFGILALYKDKMYLVGGGEPLAADGKLLGGVGISGGPRAGTDEASARAGIAAWQKFRAGMKK
jgi:uncharacterized protein GlcG (DUF336 family)